MRRPLRKTALGSILSAGALLAIAVTVEAQQEKKIPRIGVLVPTSPSLYAARIKAFQQGLHEHGYIKGKNIMLEYRYAEGKVDRFPELATELVGLKVEVIVTGPEGAVRAAQKAGSTIPIVFTSVADPVGSGLVASFARPGGNATGLTIVAPELDGKRLELLKEAFPKVTRVAFFWRIGSRGNLPFSDTEAVAKGLGLQLQPFGVRGVDDFAAAFERAKRILHRSHTYNRESHYQYCARSTRGFRGKEPFASNVRGARVRGSWWLDVLRSELRRLVAACCDLRGQNP
jgi:putative ABC transport system substrate-binding protein